MAVSRPGIRDLGLGIGKSARLHRLAYAHGPANGALCLLAADQGLEHGMAAFAERPTHADPAVALRIACESCSGIVLGIGLAEKYLGELAGQLSLVLKLNGKTDVPPDDEALAPLNGTVEDAVRLGAEAVAYTLYAGSPAQFEDFTQFSQVRQDCIRFGMPLLVWARPRGAAIERKGGSASLYALEYAARTATELGADLVALDVPAIDPRKDAQAPRPYNTLQVSNEEAIRRVVTAAGRTLVLFHQSGSASDEDLQQTVRLGMEAGACGVLLPATLDAAQVGRVRDLL